MKNSQQRKCETMMNYIEDKEKLLWCSRQGTELEIRRAGFRSQAFLLLFVPQFF